MRKAITAGLAAIMATLALADGAQAVTSTQANNIANGVSYQVCPHKTSVFGVRCDSNGVYRITGVGSGRWDAEIWTWERKLVDLASRWYTRAAFRINADGSTSGFNWLW